MNRNAVLALRVLWASSIILDLFSGVLGISHKIAVFFPAIYLSLSFVLFKRMVIGFRIFHHICVVGLVAYYLLGWFSNGADVFESSLVVSNLAYSWFSGLAVSYLVFCFMLLTVYGPFAVYQRYQARATNQDVRIEDPENLRD
jgi:hypothetical protein